MPQTQQSRGAVERDTNVPDAMEGGMDHDVQNLGEEVITHNHMLKVTHLVRPLYECLIYAFTTINEMIQLLSLYPKHWKCKLTVYREDCFFGISRVLWEALYDSKILAEKEVSKREEKVVEK